MKIEMNVWDVLKSPVVTEKSVLLKESTNEEGEATNFNFSRRIAEPAKHDIRKSGRRNFQR